MAASKAVGQGGGAAAHALKHMRRCSLPLLLAVLVLGGVRSSSSQAFGTGSTADAAALGPVINGSAQEYGGPQVHILK